MRPAWGHLQLGDTYSFDDDLSSQGQDQGRGTSVQMDFQLNKIALHTLLLPPAEERTTPPNSLCSLAAGW